MPYVSDPNLDENEQASSGGQQQGAGQVSGQPNSVSGSGEGSDPNEATDAPAAPSLASGPGGESGQGVKGAAQAPYNPSSPTTAGNWTNLQSYLDVNNGGQFGRDFSANIGKDVSAAKDAVSGAAQNFRTAVDESTITPDEDLYGKVKSTPAGLSEEDKANFKKQLNGTYAGPENVGTDSNFQRANSQARSAFSETQQAQNPGGQTALLKKFYNTPNYTAGGQALDSAILTADPDAQAAIQELAKQGSALPVDFENAKRESNRVASEGAAKSANANRMASETLFGAGGSATDLKGGAIGDLQTSVSEAVKKYNTEQSNLWNQIYGNMSSGRTSQSDLDYLVGQGAPGLDDRTYGARLADYLQQGEAATADNAITPEQAAQLQALYELAGGKNSFLTDPSRAGSYDPTRSVKFDSAAYQAAVNSGKMSYESQKKALDGAVAQEKQWLAEYYKDPQSKKVTDMKVHLANRQEIQKKLDELQKGFGGTVRTPTVEAFQGFNEGREPKDGWRQ